MKLWLAEQDNERSAAVVSRYGSLVSIVDEQPRDGADSLYLCARDGHLELLHVGDAHGVCIDESALAQRRRGRSDLMRAVGDVRDSSVLDMTAGYGVDSALMAHHGGRVTAVERHPGIYCLLDDLARRAVPTFDTICGDGRDQLSRSWDVVYLDPMFPERNKRALPNKRLQYLVALAGDTSDSADLTDWLAAGQRACTRRTVLKRRARDPVLGSPVGSVKGRSVRFDIYAPLT